MTTLWSEKEKEVKLVLWGSAKTVQTCSSVWLMEWDGECTC